MRVLYVLPQLNGWAFLAIHLLDALLQHVNRLLKRHHLGTTSELGSAAEGPNKTHQ